jgi:hypothetical protein
VGEKAGCVNVEDASTAFVALLMSVRIMLPFFERVSSLGGGTIESANNDRAGRPKRDGFIIVRYLLVPGRPSERIYDFRRAEIGWAITLVENYRFIM